MNLYNLGNGFFKLVREYGSDTEKRKTPKNVASLIFQYFPKTDEINIVRGSLMLSKAEVRAALVQR